MTLHAAIAQILTEYKKPMTSREIADLINEGRLYQRQDGLPVATSQINARVNNYFRMFDRVDKKIVLKESNIPFCEV